MEELPPRFDRVLSEIPDLTVEEKRRARYLFQHEPVRQCAISALNDEELAAYIKGILKWDMDFLYMLKRFLMSLFPGPQEGPIHREGPASSPADAKLLGESGNANLRRRNLQSTVRSL
ncbi:hypothetical protein Vretimale_17618 [Volvox reticuliferus]|uniref:Uncharacterized protein n=1 Tax=Volvox reticuliferus TaxID=1737510 RepID=A0A8J4CVA3_9CHLO|nr:hypothetical protein Vretifemale_18138 [Volvox reticuliferus]GIM14671.1 hypothetical protein Vretimale_17618 [Volvox reticuliferus]